MREARSRGIFGRIALDLAFLPSIRGLCPKFRRFRSILGHNYFSNRFILHRWLTRALFIRTRTKHERTMEEA
jgi:hypothetical protein